MMRTFLEGMASGSVSNRSGQRYKPSVCRSYAASYRLYLHRELGERRLGQVRRHDIQYLVDRLRLTHQPSTVRNAVMPLRALFRWAVAREVVETNPLAGVELPATDGRRMKAIPAPEVVGRIECLPSLDQVVWATWFLAGLRVGETRALRIADVDLDLKEIRVERNWDQHEGPVRPKSRAGRRIVPVPLRLLGYLVEHRRSLGRSKGLIFGRSEEDPFNPSSVTQRTYRVWAREGYDRLTPHGARHTFASLMIDAMRSDEALNVKVLSEIMGHSSITETYDRYGHLLPGSRNRAAQAMNGYLEAVLTST